VKIIVNTWERVQLAIIVGSGRAPTIEQVDLGLKALAVLNLSDEERAKIGWASSGSNQFGWVKGCEYELEFEEGVWQMVQVLTRSFQSWPIDERSRPLYDKVIEAKGEN